MENYLITIGLTAVLMVPAVWLAIKTGDVFANLIKKLINLFK